MTTDKVSNLQRSPIVYNSHFTTMNIQSEDNLSVGIVSQLNDTMEFCAEVSRDLIYCTHRPRTGLLSMRNAHLSSVMHNRSHQMEY